MQRLMVTFFLVISLAACATKDPRLAEFSSQMQVLNSQLATHQITHLDHSKRQLFLIQRLFPEKTKLIEYADYLVAIDTQAERGEISEERRTYLQTRKWAEYEESTQRSYARSSPATLPSYQQPSSASSGTSYNRIGNTIYGSDGTQCNVIGTSMFCN